MIGPRRLLLLLPRRRDDERSIVVTPPAVEAVRIWLSAIAVHRTGLAAAGAQAVTRFARGQSFAPLASGDVVGAGASRLQRVEHLAEGKVC